MTRRHVNCGIYSITNINNGRVYIGSSEDIAERWIRHQYALAHNQHDNIDLQSDYDRDGLSGFIFAHIEECPSDILVTRETHHVMSLGWPDRTILYNRRLPQGSHCDDSRKMMSESAKTRVVTDEYRVSHSERMSKIQLGKKRGPYKKRYTENTNEA